MTFNVANTTLHATEDNDVECQSAFTRFNIIGTYQNTPIINKYIVHNSEFELCESLQTVSPFRIYLVVTNKYPTSPQPAPMRVTFMIDGREEPAPTGVEMLYENDSTGETYDVLGRPVSHPDSCLPAVRDEGHDDVQAGHSGFLFAGPEAGDGAGCAGAADQKAAEAPGDMARPGAGWRIRGDIPEHGPRQDALSGDHGDGPFGRGLPEDRQNLHCRRGGGAPGHGDRRLGRRHRKHRLFQGGAAQLLGNVLPDGFFVPGAVFDHGSVDRMARFAGLGHAGIGPGAAGAGAVRHRQPQQHSVRRAV